MRMALKNSFKITKISKTKDCYSTLLEINSKRFLFNCGSFPDLNLSYKIPKVNAIFLSHPETSFTGNLINLIKNNKNVYSTIPVKHLSKLYIHEYDSSANFFYNKSLVKVEDIDLLDEIKTIKYFEPLDFDGLTVTAYNCGHSIGGAVWRLSIGPDNVYIGYNLNFEEENHINGFTHEISPHSIFLTDSSYIHQNIFSYSERDNYLIKTIKLFQNSKIIIPSHYARLIELLFVLNNEELKNLKINVIGNYTKTFEEYMPLFLEFSGQKAFNLLTTQCKNPFIFENVKFSNKIDEKCNIFIPVENEYFKILLNKFNDPNNLLLMNTKENNTNDAVRKHLNISENEKNLKYFEINYEEKKDVKISDNKISESTESATDLENMKEMEETILPSENLKNEEIFEPPAFYGSEKINFLKKSEMIDEEIEAFSSISEDEEYEIIEKVVEINFMQSLKQFEFRGISCINQFYKFMHNKKFQKIIFETNEESDKTFLSHLFKNTEIETLSDKNTLKFDSKFSYSLEDFGDDFVNKIDLKNYGCLKLAKIKLNKEGNLSINKSEKQRIVANLSKKEIQRKLRENEIRSEIKENKIIIEDSLELIFNKNELSILCKKYNEDVLRVKEILGEFLVYL